MYDTAAQVLASEPSLFSSTHPAANEYHLVTGIETVGFEFPQSAHPDWAIPAVKIIAAPAGGYDQVTARVTGWRLHAIASVGPGYYDYPNDSGVLCSVVRNQSTPNTNVAIKCAAIYRGATGLTAWQGWAIVEVTFLKKVRIRP